MPFFSFKILLSYPIAAFCITQRHTVGPFPWPFSRVGISSLLAGLDLFAAQACYVTVQKPKFAKNLQADASYPESSPLLITVEERHLKRLENMATNDEGEEKHVDFTLDPGEDWEEGVR